MLSRASLFLAIFMAFGLGYLIYSNQVNSFNIFVFSVVTIMMLVNSYRLSKKYKANNPLNKFIVRNGNSLKCKSTGAVSGLEIDVDKIGKVTISKNYVSIIEQNNGNGYDIFLISDLQEIRDYIPKLFTKEELDSIEIINA